jgi:hypothetical protein
MTLLGTDGRYRHIPFPEILPPVTDRDIIELDPGEFFGLVLDLTNALKDGTAARESPQALSQTPGPYDLTVRYAHTKANVEYLNSLQISDLPSQRNRSPTIACTGTEMR